MTIIQFRFFLWQYRASNITRHRSPWLFERALEKLSRLFLFSRDRSVELKTLKSQIANEVRSLKIYGLVSPFVYRVRAAKLTGRYLFRDPAWQSLMTLAIREWKQQASLVSFRTNRWTGSTQKYATNPSTLITATWLPYPASPHADSFPFPSFLLFFFFFLRPYSHSPPFKDSSLRHKQIRNIRNDNEHTRKFRCSCKYFTFT